MYLVSIAVVPQLLGENALQSFNAVLTLHALYRYADAVVLLRNDDGFHPPLHGPVKPLRSFAEVNNFFAGLLLPLLRYGLKWRAVGDLIAGCCPDPKGKLLTLIPLPQQSFSRFKNCALLSRVYSASPGDEKNVPFKEIHTPGSAGVIDMCASVVDAKPPKGYPHAASVLVVNQCDELTRNVMFPLLRDCAAKFKARAYLHQFMEAGVSEKFIETAYREVAALLLGYSSSAQGVA